jgi:hypothetical protein
MCLECEVARIEEEHLGVRDVALECFGAGGQEEGIILSPRREEWRLVRAEINLG